LDISTQVGAWCLIQDPVPTFYLYGEPHRSVSNHFLHAESLDGPVRDRPVGQFDRIPTACSNHLILIADGGGVMHAEGAMTAFESALPAARSIPGRARLSAGTPNPAARSSRWRTATGTN
jgi:hypothetical protein